MVKRRSEITFEGAARPLAPVEIAGEIGGGNIFIYQYIIDLVEHTRKTFKSFYENITNFVPNKNVLFLTQIKSF